MTHQKEYANLMDNNLRHNSPESVEINAINYKREIGIENSEKEAPYFMSITEDNNGDLWMASNTEGIWRNNGKKNSSH